MANKPSLSLLIEQGPKSGHCLQCKSSRRVTIGRAKANTLQISKDTGISQKHLAFFWVASSDDGDAGWSVTDLGSSNGTLLNNLQIEPNLPISIKAGDLIKIGAETSIRVAIPSSVLDSSNAIASSECKGISKPTDSHAKGTASLEVHHEIHTCLSSAVHDKPPEEMDRSKHILPAEENHYKDGPVSVEHHRARVSQKRGGQERDKCKSSGQNIDLSMTVKQWFVHLMEEGPKYLHQASESMIQDILLESKQFDEYVRSLNAAQ